MNGQSVLVCNLILAAILAVFLVIGARRGLIRTVFGLLGLCVALVGASMLTDMLAPRAAQVLEPRLAAVVSARLDEQVTAALPDADLAQGQAGHLDGLLGAIQDTRTYKTLAAALVEAVQKCLAAAAANTGEVIARAIAQSVARMVLLPLLFVAVLLAWRLLGHILNLAGHLPGLRTLNCLGGAAVGLLQGALVCLLAVWLARWLGVLPDEAAQGEGPIGWMLELLDGFPAK